MNEAIDYIKTIYPNLDTTDKTGIINGNFWSGIADLMDGYNQHLKKMNKLLADGIIEKDREIVKLKQRIK